MDENLDSLIQREHLHLSSIRQRAAAFGIDEILLSTIMIVILWDSITLAHTLEQMILSGFFDSIGLYERPSDPQRKIADQWLALANLSELRNVPFIDLSIGLQRVALIVRAVIKHPPLLILDEPLEGLDDENSSLVKNLINVLTAKMRINEAMSLTPKRVEIKTIITELLKAYSNQRKRLMPLPKSLS